MNAAEAPPATDPAAVLAVDLGGSAMKGAVVSSTGAILAEITRPTPPVDLIDALIALFTDLRARADDAGHRAVGAAIATPGMVDETNGIVHYASNLGWSNMPVADLLRDALELPVALGHDVRTAGIAERLVGAAVGTEDFVLVPIGTGVAAALVTANESITGASGAAGEFGHIPVVPGGEPCVCGQFGCLEVYASGAGVARRYRAAGGEQLTSREIVERLGADPIADRVWAEAVAVLAHGLNTLTLLLDPAVIVLGGGFARAGDALFVPLEGHMRDGLTWRSMPRVVPSRLGADAGRIGAAVLAFRAADMGSIVESWSGSSDATSGTLAPAATTAERGGAAVGSLG